MDVDKNTKKQNDQNQKKCFWSKFEQKSILDDRIATFRASADTKTSKNRLSTMTRCQNGPEIQKHIDRF